MLLLLVNKIKTCMHVLCNLGNITLVIVSGKNQDGGNKMAAVVAQNYTDKTRHSFADIDEVAVSQEVPVFLRIYQ